MNDQSLSAKKHNTAVIRVLSDDNCVICRDPLEDDKQKVHKKGLDTLIHVSGLRGDNELHDYLVKKSLTTPISNVFVHNIRRCRVNYTRDPEGDMRRASSNILDEGAGSTAPQITIKSR